MGEQPPHHFFFGFAQTKNLFGAKQLLDNGAKADLPDPLDGMTPLFAAANNGNAALVSLLAAHGASVLGANEKFNSKQNGRAGLYCPYTPLMVACEKGWCGPNDKTERERFF